jgi:PAS domain S-box-containing protein
LYKLKKSIYDNDTISIALKMKSFRLLRWLKNVSITRKLYFVVGIMALLIVIELFVLSFMIHTLSSTRALVGAEGLWSKAEKDAVYSLTKYRYTHNEKDYQQYLSLLAVPLGDHKTRLALSQAVPDLNIARNGFIAGRVYPGDIDGIIDLLIRFHSISYVNSAIGIWTDGDKLLDELQFMGARLHTQVSLGNIHTEEIDKTLESIYQLNERITGLEDNFSFTLGEGSRWIESLILKILFLIAITVEFTGLFLTTSVSRAITRGIDEIVRIAQKVSIADFSDRAKVFSNDEIGLVARSFNEMTDNLQKKITEQKQTENALRGQRDLYESLLTTQSEMGEGVSITEGEKIIYVNDAVCSIYGYPREEILESASFFDYIPEEEKPIMMERFRQRSEGARDQSSGETKIRKKDNKIVEVEYTVRNLIVDGKKQTISIIRDITEKKRAAEHLVKEKERAESAELAKKIGEQFLANMSHEIRTPMNAIIGFTDVVLKTPLSEEQQKYLGVIKTSGNNLLVIINDILDFSKIRAGKMRLERREFNLSQTISFSIEMLLPKAREKGLNLFYTIEEDVPGNLIGDPIRLSQVLINLIANAIKFTEKGGVSVTVKKLQETSDKIEIEFSLKDTGIGIAENKIATIFDAFTQANSDTTRKYGGTGLGLAIVKQLADMQGGSITLTSEEGKGSEFIYRISYSKNNKPLEAAKMDKESFVSHKNLNILLVEDNEVNQTLAKKILNDWGWKVQVAEDGDTAIGILKYNDFDLVLMDIQLPGKDGYETTQIIRSKLPLPKCNIPIIAMTAHVMASEEEKCYSVGMNDYVPKPIDEVILYHKIVSSSSRFQSYRKKFKELHGES